MESRVDGRVSRVEHDALFEEHPLPSLLLESGTLRILRANLAARALYGWDEGGPSGLTVDDLRPPDEPAAILVEPGRGETATVAVSRHVTRNGEIRSVEIRARRVPGRDGEAWLASVNDVTRLAQSEANLERLVQQAPCSIQTFAPDGRLKGGNVASLRMFGSLAGAAGYNILADPQLDASGVMPLVREAFAGSAVAIPPTLHAPRSSTTGNRALWTHGFMYPVKDANGHIEEVVLIQVDVTDLKTAEDALRTSEERFRHLARATDQIVWEWRTADGSVWRHDATGGVFDAVTTEAGTVPEWTSRVHPEDAARVVGSLWEAVASDDDRWSAEYRMRRADGTYAVVYDRASIIRDDDGRATRVIGIVLDVSPLTQAQREAEAARRALAEVDKFAALGQLVSGVAHEIRTPLTIISNHAHLLQIAFERASASPREAFALPLKGEPLLSGVHDGVTRIANLVEELRRFTRGNAGAPALVSLHKPVGDAIALFSAAQPERIPLTAELHETLPVLVDPIQVQQVVLNLLENAVDATRATSGQIFIRTEPDDATGGARLVVVDEGCGIAPDAQRRMFDPLFTTKPDGTGLGLSIVRRIVESHRATIAFDTRPGRTEFVVAFPPALSSA